MDPERLGGGSCEMTRISVVTESLMLLIKRQMRPMGRQQTQKPIERLQDKSVKA